MRMFLPATSPMMCEASVSVAGKPLARRELLRIDAGDRRFELRPMETQSSVCLDLAPDAASAFAMEPPGFRLHAYTPATGVVTHLAAIGEFDGPHPFHEPGGALID